MDDFLLPGEVARPDGNLAPPAVPTPSFDFLLPGELPAAMRAASAVRSVLATDPDKAAQAKVLGKAAGLPTPVVERNFDTVAGQEKLRQIQGLMQTSPILARQLSDPEFAKLAHDDVPNLSLFGTLVNSFKRGVPGLKQIGSAIGLKSSASMLNSLDAIEGRMAAGVHPAFISEKEDPYSLARMPREERTLLRSQLEAAIPRRAGAIAGYEAEKKTLPEAPIVAEVMAAGKGKPFVEGMGLALNAFRSAPLQFLAAIGPENLLTSAPGLIIGGLLGLTGNPVGAVAAVGLGSFATDYGSTILEAMGSEGVDINDPKAIEAAAKDDALMKRVGSQAFRHAAIVGPVDAASGGLASKLALPKKLAASLATKPITREVAGMATKTLAGGVLGGIGEAGGELAAGQDLLPGNILAEIVGEAFPAPAETLSIGAKQMHERIAQAKQAVENTAIFTQLDKVIATNKVRERSPADFHQFAEQAAADGPVENIHIEAKVLAETLQQSGVDPSQLPPVLQAQLQEALASGSDVVVPFADYATHVAGTDIGAALLPHLRASADAMSQAQAEDYYQNAHDEFKQTAEKILAEKEGDDAFHASGQVVEDTITAQLTAANRFTPDVNTAYAGMVRDFYKVNAVKFGITPEAMYARYPLHIQAENVAGGQTLEQDKPAVVDYQKVQDAVESDPSYTYHATNAERADEIADSGAMKRHKPHEFTDQSVWPDGSKQKRNYFSSSAEHVWQFAPEEGKPVLLRIHKDAHPFKTEITGDLYSTKDVPASAIEYLGIDGAWHPLSKRAQNVTPAGQETGQTGVPLGEQDGLHGQQSTGAEGLPEHRSELPGDQNDDPALRRTLSGGHPKDGWTAATSISRAGSGPTAVFRGSTRSLSSDHFKAENLGFASKHPTSGLGIFFTETPEGAAKYGDVEGFYLDIRNPMIYDTDSVPGFNSLEEATAFREALRAQEYDGIVIDHRASKGEMVVVAFDPEQVIRFPQESAADKAANAALRALNEGGTFEQAPAHSFLDSTFFQAHHPTFYSELGKQIDAAKMGAAPAQGWKDFIRGLIGKGVKKDEIEATGINDWLDLQEGKVTKAQVAEFLAGNGVQIEEVTLGQPKSLTSDERITLNVLAGQEERTPAAQDEYERLREIERASSGFVEPSAGETRFHGYQLPGGENYREMLLTLPAKAPEKLTELPEGYEAGTDRSKPPEHRWQIFPADQAHGRPFHGSHPSQEAATADAIEHLNYLRTEGSKQGGFRSSHFDQPNIIGHVRFNERTDADGKKVLFIEELQSDWAQKGKKEGFRHEVYVPQNMASMNRGPEFRTRAEAEAYIAALPVGLRDNIEIQTYPKRGTPTAPFVSKREFAVFKDGEELTRLDKEGKAQRVRYATHELAQAAATKVGSEARDMGFGENTPAWTALLLKRMIRYAAENGFERIAWTTGEQQASRYDLSKHIDRIHYEPTDDGKFEVIAFKYGSTDDSTGSEVFHEDEIGLDRIEEVLGKEIAKKIESTEGDDIGGGYRSWRELKGEDLKVGGEGMKAYYDQIVPNVANDILKKLGGGRVDSVSIPEAGLKKGRSDFKVGPTPRGNGYTFYDLEGNRIGKTFKSEELARAALADMFPVTMQPGFDITPAMREKVMAGQPLFQRSPEDTARGQISFPQGGMGSGPSIITLGKNADLSTFLHELGHFYLEVYSHIIVQPDAPTEIRADFDALLKWFDLPIGSTWNTMTLNEKRPYHEQLARGFEAYLFEGQAPSIELANVFARFRAWMLNVYKHLSALKVELTPEVRGVFDRMLATNEEIVASEAARGFAPLFKSAVEAGMTATEWQSYQALGQQATQDAVDQLQTRSLRDMQWLTNARGKLLKALQRDAAEKRKAVRREVEAEVLAEPINQVRTLLKQVEHRLSIPALEAAYPEGSVGAPAWRNLPRNLLGREGLAPDMVAEMYGYSSGDELVQKLLSEEPAREKIEGLTDQRMLERYGDLSNPAAIARAANEAIHNDARTRFVASELHALNKATGQRQILARAAKQFAEAIIGRKKIRDIKPAQFAAAEARAARAADQARRKGDLVAAATEKRNQLVNAYATRAAYDGLDAAEKAVNYLKKFDREGSRKALDIDYLDQIDKLLERFDLRKGQTLTAIDKRKSLADWVQKQEDQGLVPVIDEALLNEASRKSYKDMTLEELRGLTDAVKNIEHLGRLKKTLLTAKDKREFDAVVDDIEASIRDNAKRNVPEERSSDRGVLVSAKRLFSSFLASHRKFASQVREMDGWTDGGPAWEYLIRNMNEAGNNEAVAREQATMTLLKMMAPLQLNPLKLRAQQAFSKEAGKTFYPQVGKSFSAEERVAIALNMGNETNIERLQTGERLSPAALQAILADLTPVEANFVNETWALLESFRPQIAAKERRLTGVEPAWVDAQPFTLRLKTGETLEMTGGYYPIKYDPLRSDKSSADIEAEVAKQMTQGLYARSQTKRGHLKARTESTGRPMRYDLDVIAEHVSQVVHDLAWHEYLIDANRLLRSGRIENAVREHYGNTLSQSMKKTLTDIAQGEVGSQESLDLFMNHLRFGTTIVGLGFNVSNTLINIVGLTQSMSRIGTKWVAKGVIHWAGDAAKLESSLTKIYAKSDFMRLRGKTMNRELNEIRNTVSGESGKLKATYFWLQNKTQMIVDVPTWYGAYEKAMAAEDMSEAKAVALADQAVLDAQGGGQVKDLSGVQRGGPGLKLFTTFYSFFNTTYNLTAEAYGRTNFKKPGDVLMFAADMALLYTIPALLGTLVKAALKGDWDDEDKLIKTAIADQLAFVMGSMAFLREATFAAQAATGVGSGMGYSGPASMRFLSDLSQLGVQAHQGEADAAFWKTLNNVAGALFHYPAGQINRTVEGAIALVEGRTENPAALLVGPVKH